MSAEWRGAFVAALAAVVAVVIVAASTGHATTLDFAAALVLAPCASVATLAAGRRLGGRRFGLAAAFVYAGLPLFGLAYSLSEYRHTFTHDALPQLVGLEAPGRLAIGVLLVAALATLPRWALCGAGAIAAVVAIVVWGTHPLSGVRSGLHETVWSIAFIEWVAVAGVIGAATRSARLAAALAGWLVFVVLHAAHGGYGDHAEFWSSLAPATPALALTISSLALLVPRLRPAARTVQPADVP